jgi:hypothetical protein
MINPVRSARLTTSGKKTIKYGRVEVEAKLPAGDWMWPAIWMMPQDSVYGEWPRSGEIDIMESRGNDAERYPLGNNIISSAMHWGTLYDTDAFRLSMGEWGSKRTKYSDGFHTFGLEWNEKYLFTWLDGRLRVSSSWPKYLFLPFLLPANLAGLPRSKSSFSTSPRIRICGNTANLPASPLTRRFPRIRGAKLGAPTPLLTNHFTSFSTLPLAPPMAGSRRLPPDPDFPVIIPAHTGNKTKATNFLLFFFVYNRR